MASTALPKIADLRNLLEYHPSDGSLTWKVRPRSYFKSDKNWKWWNARYAGKRADTTFDKTGYRKVKIFDRQYSVHRIVWAIIYGYWPEIIDHRNGDIANNRLTELRDGDNQQNSRNQKLHSRNKSGFGGVFWHERRGQWQAHIKMGDKSITLGWFDTFMEAKACRQGANKVAGFTDRHGT